MKVLFYEYFFIICVGLFFIITLEPIRGAQREPFNEFFPIFPFDPPGLQWAPYDSKDCTTCPFVYFPVCGDDGVTYINECKLRCFNHAREYPVNMTRSGPCRVFPSPELE